ncbi:MAG: hypothetical protein LBG58_01080 [Planctomycetaceae bacterium]|jgi:hypothetical protein|nr:hypothetical protein [Planctomycetaceae bacterium]
MGNLEQVENQQIIKKGADMPILQRKVLTFILVIFLIAVINIAYANEKRTWTATSGHKTEAEFVKIENGKIVLKKTDGKIVKVPREKLVEADQKYAEEQQKKIGEDNPFAEEETTSTTESVSSQTSPPSPHLTADEKKQRLVTVEGIGSNFEEAKRDAFRNAMNEVVGTLIDAETRVQNESILEEMLMANNAYISKYKMLSTKKQDGLTVIRIEAIVEKLAVLKRMQPSNASIKSVDGESLAASIDTKNADDDAKVQILAKVLKDQNYPFSILEATAKLNPEPVKRNGDSLEMEVKVTVQMNYQKFDEFRKTIEPVLKKIAIAESTSVIKDMKVQSFSEFLGQDKKAFCHINTSRNAKLTNCGYKTYKLPDKAVAILLPYAQIVPAVDILLCNVNGDAVLTERIAVTGYSRDNTGFAGTTQYAGYFEGMDLNKIGQGSIFTYYRGYNHHYRHYPKHFLLEPFSSISRDDEFSSTLFFTPTVKIESSELKQVKSVKCEIISNCPPLDEVYQKLPETLKNWNPEREKGN